ncbi:MAG: T9SS type A sorting domain-containing protein [Dysgonomonas sp.]
MSKILLKTFLVFVFSLLVCNVANSRTKGVDEIPQSVISDADATDAMLAKATEFRNALTANGSRGASVYVYDALTVRKYTGEAGAKKLAARIILMGYTDVLLDVRPINGTLDFYNKTWIQNFNRYLNQYSVRVHALMFSEPSQFNPSRDILIYNQANIIQNYNATVAANERFAGASADWEPHLLTVDSPLADATYGGGEEGANLAVEDRWADDRYGKGAANDRLLKRTGDMLEYAKKSLDDLSNQKSLPLLTLNEAIYFHVQNQYNAGLLDYGNVTNYLAANRCSDINVMAYNNNMVNVWSRGRVILEAADASNLPQSVYICIKTRLGDDEGPGTSLKPQGWSYLIQTLNYLHTQAASYTSFKGISVYDYSDTEDMWLTGSTPYHADEKEAMYNFLLQPSAVSGVKNYERLGLSAEDMNEGTSTDAWMDKLELNGFILCEGSSVKRIVRIIASDSDLAGEFDCSKMSLLDRLDFNGNGLTDITLPAINYIEVIFLANNKLKKLDAQGTQIGALNCANNEISELLYNKDKSGYYINVSNNYLMFSSFPKKDTFTDMWRYSPQKTITGKPVGYNELIDLSSEFSVYGSNTTYSWSNTAQPLQNNGNGTFVAGEANKGRNLVCTMTNSYFPLLNLLYSVKVNDTGLGINDSEDNDAVKIAFNSDNGTLDLNKQVDAAYIFNLMGRMLLSENNVNSLNLYSFPQGLYIVKVINENKEYQYKILKK